MLVFLRGPGPVLRAPFRFFGTIAATLVAGMAVPVMGQALADAAASEPAAEAPAPAPLPEGSVGGMGDINLYPKRVVISDRERTASIGLYNRADTAGEYEMVIGDMAMREDGQVVALAALTDPAERARVKTASALLKWSPHRIDLPASEALMVRIMARIPPGLPQGEYRAHFTVISVPPQGDATSIEQAIGEATGGGMSVQIRPRFGITIPVIVRIGETTLTAGIADIAPARLADGGPALRLRITREGTRSAFGDIAVTAPGAKKPIAEMKGVGVYTEIAGRSVLVPIDPKADPASYARGAKLTITYTDDDFAPGKVLARQDYVVP